MATAAGFKTPEMNWDATDLRDELAKFKQYCDLIFSGPYSKKSPKEQATFILLWIGRRGLETYNSWIWAEAEDSTNPAKIWERFEKHVAPKVNHRLARYQLQQLRQTNDEFVDVFLTRCRNQATRCRFRDNDETDERLIEQLIVGTKHKKVQERLLEKGEQLTLGEAMDIARTYEATQSQMEELDGESNKDIHGINENESENKAKKCPNCGLDHPLQPRKKCPAYGSVCLNCQKENHWARVCRSRNQGGTRGRQRNRENPRSRHHSRSIDRRNRRRSASGKRRAGNRRELSDQFETITFESITVDVIGPQAQPANEVFVTVNVDLHSISSHPAALKAKLDTGAQGNILPLRLYRRMYPENLTSEGFPKPGVLEHSSTVLTAYGGAKLVQHGKCRIDCVFNGRKSAATFFVTEADGPAIIGLPTCLELNLVTLNCSVQQGSPLNVNRTREQVTLIKDKGDLVKRYPDCFDGVGKFQGQYHITVDPSVPPVVHAQRRVPLSLRDDIKDELDDMESRGIITKLKEGEPTAWVNSLVYRRKPNGKLRICLDPKDLNKAISREHHVIPTLEEILPKLSGAKYFSIVDAKCGYWNVELDQASSYLTTFNSPFGRYRFLRMPFGLKMSQDVFQAKIDQTFEGCEGTIGIADDIVIFGKSEQEHDNHLHGMLTRCRNTGLKLNPDKCKIKQKKIKFYGVICGEDGVQPDPSKVSALKQMAPPTNKQELQAFLGLATYMGPFISDLSTLTAPLRELVKENSLFDWNSAHQQAFDAIKNAINAEAALAYYDPTKEVTLQVDASSTGLGAALLQDKKPIAFASKALTDTESRYANIERELLAVVYGCERFHTYLYGRSFIAESDHKPLEAIQLKNLMSAPPRLQRMLLRLQPYDVTIKYRPGKQVLVADALSRLSPEEKIPIPDLNVEIHDVCPQFSSECLQRIRAETAKDPELSALKEVVYNGWPTTVRELPSLIRPYWTFREELSIEDSLIFKGHRIVVPQALQGETLSKLHTSHQGIEKTKLRARSSVFWRNLNSDIEEMTKSCAICQELQPKQAREPLIQTEVPPRPWHTVGTDIFYLDDDEFLLIADYYTKYPFVRKIPKGNSTSKCVADLTKQIFSEQGIPRIVRSDNGPHFQGCYRQFAEEYGFSHVTSSPNYPRSNGFIESQVKSVKRALKKAKRSNSDPNIALLCLRATPIDSKLPSPAELLLGRQVQDNLPRKFQRDHTYDDVIGRLQERQAQQKYYHDQHATALPSLVPGQQVTIQNPKTLEWKPAIVLDKAREAPRSYIVSTPSGKELRRNRSHIRQVPQPRPRQVKFDLRSNQVRSPSAGIDLPISLPRQPNPESSASPPSLVAQPDSPTPGAAQPVASAAST